MSRAITNNNNAQGNAQTLFDSFNVVDVCLDLGVGKTISYLVTDNAMNNINISGTDYTVEAEIIEGFNPGNGAKPTRVNLGAVPRILRTRKMGAVNRVDVHFPEDITSAVTAGMVDGRNQAAVAEWSRAPEVNRPVWGFYTVVLKEVGTTGFEQDYTLAKGAVQVRYIV